ncbi:MAG TPA: type II secretion system protein N [Spongiibacteraceae bacterium]|jgi:type II secretory pathway component PulC
MARLNRVALSVLDAYLPRALLVMLLLTWGAYMARSVSVLWHDSTTEPVAANSPRAKTESFSTIAATDINAVRALNLFGHVAVPPPIDPANLPATPLNLKLAGIFESTLAEESRALIADAGKPAKTYFTGDSLPGSAILNRIGSDYVVIQRGDRLEKLPLHSPSIATAAPVRHGAALATLASVMSPAPAPITPTNMVPVQTVYKELESRLAAIRQPKQ